MFLGIGLPLTAFGTRGGVADSPDTGVSSGAMMLLAGETQGLALDFTDDAFQSSTGFWGSAAIIDTGTPANNYDTSPTTTASSLLTMTAPSPKLVMGPAGTLRYGAHNLCLQSQDFTTTWTANATTRTANATTAPDGTTTADLLVPTAANDQHVVSQIISNLINGATYTHTTRIKAAGYSVACLFENGTFRYGAWFDLSTVAVTATFGAGYVSSSITSEGNGWYLCSVTFLSDSTSQAIAITGTPSQGAGTIGDTIFTGDGTSGVYVWGAHLRRTPSDSTYLSTTTAARYALPLEWSSAGVLQGLLVEEARTNLFLHSGDAGNAAWTANNNNLTATANAVTGKLGTQTAALLVPTAANTIHNTQQGPFTVSSGATVTHTMVLKAAGYTFAAMTVFDSAHRIAYFNLGAGSLGTLDAGVTASITNLGDGWYLCSMTYTITGTSVFGCVFVSDSQRVGLPAFVGDTLSGIYLDSAQIEVGSFPTSYIQTFGSTVTRAADAKNNATTIAPSIATAGTRVIRARTALGSGTQVLGVIDDGTANERYRIERNTSNEIRFIVTDGGVEQANLNLGTVANDTEFNVAVAWSANDIAGCLNGGTVQTDGSATLPTVTTQRYGSSSSGQQWNGLILSDVLLPERKANATLQTLTT